jgi:hypothetical protein
VLDRGSAARAGELCMRRVWSSMTNGEMRVLAGVAISSVVVHKMRLKRCCAWRVEGSSVLVRDLRCQGHYLSGICRTAHADTGSRLPFYPTHISALHGDSNPVPASPITSPSIHPF